MTLMELLVVIAILGILMGLLMPGLGAARYAAHKARARSEIKQIETAWKAYYEDYRELPSGVNRMDAGNGVDILNGNNRRQIRYMEFDDAAINNGFKDKWGRLYQVSLDSVGDGQVSVPDGTVSRSVAVWSAGRDMEEGTADDITSWE